MEGAATSINELPFEILMEIFEYFSISEIARFPMTCTHWRDLMKQDHFWASLARKTYGQYVGETPTKRDLEELSKRCGQDLSFMHWLQYRSLFGLTMNMAVHIGVFVPDDVFDYKVTLEPGLNTKKHMLEARGYFPHDLAHEEGIISTSATWKATFFLVITPEAGDQIRKEIPLISFAELTGHHQTRHHGKIFKYKVKITKLTNIAYARPLNYYAHFDDTVKTLDVFMQTNHLILKDNTFQLARVGFPSHIFNAVFRYENPFIYPPSFVAHDLAYPGNVTNFMYQDLQIHEYIPILAKNFNEAIKSQMKLYLAEIVCGFEFLHSHNLYLKDCIPVIKKDGHLQFIYAGPRSYETYSYFGLSPTRPRGGNLPYHYDYRAPKFPTDCYSLGIFLLEVCTGEVLPKAPTKVTLAKVPQGLSVELTDLLSTACTHWRDLMKQDHFWASLARKTYGQYVGETPTKRDLEELSKRCGQELTFMHWLQYRSLFGLTMNMAVHVGVFMPDDGFDYKLTLEPGLNMGKYKWNYPWHTLDDGVVSTVATWKSTFFLVITPEAGDQIRKEIPLLSLTELGTRSQIRHSGKVYKYKIKVSKLMSTEYTKRDGVVEHTEHSLSRTAYHVLTPVGHVLGREVKLTIARSGFKSQYSKAVYRYENPFIYPPTFVSSSSYQRGNVSVLMYQDLKIHEYIPILAKNFNEVIKSQMKLYLAEIVCGFEFLHSHNLYVRDCIPLMKKDGHLQFIYAGPRDKTYSYFGLAKEQLQQDNIYEKVKTAPPFQTDCHALGIFLLEVCTGHVLPKSFDQVTDAKVSYGLSVELTDLLSTLIAENYSERPKNIVLIKKSPYFKGIDWHKMRLQDWSPKFLPNLDFNEDKDVAQDSRNSSPVCN